MSALAPRPASGLVIAAPSSGSGKTVLTLAMIRALRRAGRAVASAKTGPDYIDPAFHALASGRACINLDAYAMRADLLGSLAARQAADADLLIIEGVMGLFDGAASGGGSTADLAAQLDLPVVLVIDAGRQSQSVAALARGFRDHRPDITLAGVLLNRCGSDRHRAMLEAALATIDMPVFGAVPRDAALTLPERHLGLHQASEHADFEGFVERAAALIAEHSDLTRIIAAARPVASPVTGNAPEGLAPLDLAPLGQRIAVARDLAFSFAYPHLLDGWRRQGAELSFFSPLANEGPGPECDAVFLPGGYPELHAGRLAAADRFRAGMHQAAARNALIYGECGGYMVLGDDLTDAEGTRHQMLGLLPLETSFARRKRHLGYRRLHPFAGLPWQGPLTGHEFHYATVVREGAAERLFQARDASGVLQPDMGLRQGRVMGSFAHVIDRA
ncbi:cobyrinate a,c-diamide synthase [Stappia taiwanensis]|uniref:Hydrogenobyrinate a,c-diamide synthase n=1 Tax=Stappia taiwanensis TaxID=992267 RepID=A0A838Y026_9HYPH|nr:cobyrinate a,c-diamide synthase [Stappia taiwanensis]MBA4612604.1 cobyrinate a,c-diamide synthase [Stappia taiwanensis]GGE89160.1 hydrogenobyrinate a,c-diamide synthase [Stappia taiwanensis]